MIKKRKRVKQKKLKIRKGSLVVCGAAVHPNLRKRLKSRRSKRKSKKLRNANY